MLGMEKTMMVQYRLLQWSNVYTHVKALSNPQVRINTWLDNDGGGGGGDDVDDPVGYNQDNYTCCLSGSGYKSLSFTS